MTGEGRMWKCHIPAITRAIPSSFYLFPIFVFIYTDETAQVDRSHELMQEMFLSSLLFVMHTRTVITCSDWMHLISGNMADGLALQKYGETSN